ncbi:acyltransferase [Pontibacter sp. JH31]|uniref:Acyltransferase n=1 Tax=Pontibacter aquaedesilientis TaxID=2766980 RepID=A0ABR7XIZ5_9BACT|nr:acyltransferase family protein [Pontibacter aquaedesilientis]MBD1398260.1 acyltransferase [Pontibacter aquaedesilientis]
MLIKRITLGDAAFLKGIAILIIMLHNYFHILDKAPGENEFSFSDPTVYTFLYNLITSPLDIFRQTFSFFGHYAVQIFVFLSGYGLAIQYSQDRNIKYAQFYLKRFKKIYPVLFFAVVLLFIYKTTITLLFPAKAMDLATFAYEGFFKLLLVSNLIPDQALSISGPWWFFGLILQLYLISPFLLKLKRDTYLIACIVIPWLIQLAFIVSLPTAIPFIRVNFLGHLPEFALGIYLARKSIISMRLLPFALALLIFGLGSFSQYFWLLAFFSVPFIALAFYYYTAPSKRSIFAKAITFFGNNSLYFFAVHGLCRSPFVALGNRSIVWSLIAAVAYLAVVFVFTMVFKFIVNKLMSLVAPALQKT